ncbi:MAG: DUF6311 domain-containing protein [Candidatus Gastranaerophilales bacterium]|nr:DUF6311 domain-containing protein [Candidatus Gastranaerophilales bacterium]
MNLCKNKELLYSIISALFIGGLIFIMIFGIKIVNPLNDNWILNPTLLTDDFTKGFHTRDLGQSYIGWQFYSKAPWTFPLGLYDDLSYPVKTSILNTDSIPIFAVIFKFLLNILPQSVKPATFQYHGLWILICFMMQSCLGILISRKYINIKSSRQTPKF